jgi:hypothetical protein
MGSVCADYATIARDTTLDDDKVLDDTASLDVKRGGW